ncbi:MAG: SMC-Scp complex subunit ScpB [Sphaerochaetaceae bacterium]|jgi:segregation and condensation protein B
MSHTLLSLEARLIEVFLFLENEPLSLEQLKRFTQLEDEVLLEALDELKEYWAKHMHGLDLVETLNHWGFTPSSDLHERLRVGYGKKVDRRLSKAALETLAIIAYSQPVTRREIENIRGVASDNILRVLREREYVVVVGKKPVPGAPSLFGTTKKFLLEFNLRSIKDLPTLSEVDQQRFIHQEELFDEQ